MSDFEAPFNLEGEWVTAELAELDEMAAALPMTADIANQRKEELLADPKAYFEARAAEQARVIEKADKILRIAGIKKEGEN